MIEETISRIEERLRAAAALDPAERAELQELLARLRNEARALPAGALVAEDLQDDEDVQSTINRLGESLTAFEASHPQLTSLVNRISAMLANMGI